MKTKIRNSISGLVLIALVLTCFALLPSVQAAPDPAPPPAGNTRDGQGALAHITTGQFNTAFGTNALNTLTTGNNNAAQGNSALFSNNGNGNVGVGNLTLRFNTTGSFNTAVGGTALNSNITGTRNAALGYAALRSNTNSDNTAIGFQALVSNGTGSLNTAAGSQALLSNTSGGKNAAYGVEALRSNTIGNGNTAVGDAALFLNTSGGQNIALGNGAGDNLTTGSNNIDIGNEGVAGEANTIRIGVEGTQTATFIAGISGVNEGGAGIAAVYINNQGRLGTTPPASSRRFKKEIQPMAQTSEAILGLKPVTFYYKNDTQETPQFGLIAEEVAEANQDLVVRDENGEIYSVRYEAVNAMLLNEFLKEHRKNEEQEKRIDALTAQLQEQAAQIQKVSAQLEAGKTAPQVVGNNR
jgi:hypothetical protein